MYLICLLILYLQELQKINEPIFYNAKLWCCDCDVTGNRGNILMSFLK